MILIDDGSKDLSGKIIDEWGKKDSRILTIHKENGGLSAARNSGIENAKGDYLVFVDADDWIALTMIEEIMSQANVADIICFGMIQAMDYFEKPLAWFKEKKKINQEEALNYLVENTIMTSHVPSKVYTRILFDTIRFPEGKIFEDIRTMHKIFMAAHNVLIVDKAYYYYYVRHDSISNIVKLSNRLEWYEALKERAEDVKDIKPEYREIVMSQMAVTVSLSIVQNKFLDEEKRRFKNKLCEIKRFLKKKDTRVAVKKYATRSQYVYYLIARRLGFRANTLYKLIIGTQRKDKNVAR